MEEHEFTESREFPGPFVRVRGRLSREWQVQWNPSLRTYKGPPDKPVPGSGNNRTAVSQTQFAVDFLDYQGKVLESLPTVPHFLAKDQEWATFVARLPYHSATQSMRLRFGEREISVLPVPTDRPFFSLLHPGEDSFIDGRGVLALHWCGHDDEHPMTFFVRYSHDGRDWLRPGVNLRTNDFYLDLREMPGGARCAVQVLATNGYRTSYVQTRHFEVPRKPPEVFLGETDGPVLFVQGFSRENGPITGEQIAWLDRDGNAIRRGGTLDVRSLPPGVHRLSVMVQDAGAVQTTELIGIYDAPSGRRLPSSPGL